MDRESRKGVASKLARGAREVAVDREVKVLSCYELQPVAEGNCVVARREREQPEAKRQSEG